MPREACRLVLEVTSVRVETLQGINHDDAVAEGMGIFRPISMSAQKRFRELWDQINRDKHPWSSNPWVWVVEFKRIDQLAKGGR